MLVLFHASEAALPRLPRIKVCTAVGQTSCSEVISTRRTWGGLAPFSFDRP